MRLVILSGLVVIAAACATKPPPQPAPGAFERVADRLNDPAAGAPCLLTTHCHYGKRRLEREMDANAVDRRDGIVIATAIGDRKKSRIIKPDPALQHPASDPTPKLPEGVKTADTPN